MRRGPLRRPVALLGLLVLLPTAWMLASGQLSAQDAGLRAIVTFGAVLLVNRFANWGVHRSLKVLARDAAVRRIREAGAAGAAQQGGPPAG